MLSRQRRSTKPIELKSTTAACCGPAFTPKRAACERRGRINGARLKLAGQASPPWLAQRRVIGPWARRVFPEERPLSGPILEAVSERVNHRRRVNYTHRFT